MDEQLDQVTGKVFHSRKTNQFIPKLVSSAFAAMLIETGKKLPETKKNFSWFLIIKLINFIKKGKSDMIRKYD